MRFWGVEVRPGSHYTYLPNVSHGRLRICQATLGSGNVVMSSLLQCIVGNRSPILLCSLIPNVVETCRLEIEFEEDDKVIFSVLGQRSVHLSGYLLRPNLLMGGDESDSYVHEGIGEEDSSSYGNYDSDEDKYESDFIDDSDLEMVPPSPKYKSSGVIEEIVEKYKPASGNASQRCLKRKYVASDMDDRNDDFRCLPVVMSKSSMELENEDEDGFPISFFPKIKNSAKAAGGNSKLGDSAVYIILESEEEDGNAKPAEGNPDTGAVAVDEEKKRKIDAISEDLESARGTSQPCDSSLLPSEMGFENNGIPKKKKNVKDEKPLEMISDWERVSGDPEQDRVDTEVGKVKMETKEKDLLVGGHVDMAEKDEKLKKKNKDMAKKGKACQTYADFLTERTEEGAERDPNELIGREVMDEVLPVGSIPATRMSMTRRIFALDSLDATKTDWEIEVQVKQKGDLRAYNNSKGNGFVFDVILADKNDKQIRAVMFNKAACKFYPEFKLGKIYYISGGTIRPAKEQYKIADNDYEIILEKGAIVKEVDDDDSTPNAKSNFDKIDHGKVTSMEVPLSKITNDPTLDQGKANYFNIKVYVTYISPDQTMWFWACKTCHKKVTESVDSGYWCVKCNGIVQCCLRYVMEVKISDHSGDAWVTVFNEVAENLIGCTAEELARIKASEGYDKYQLKLEKAIGTQHLFRVSVQHVEFMNKKRQKITVLAQAPADR